MNFSKLFKLLRCPCDLPLGYSHLKQDGTMCDLRVVLVNMLERSSSFINGKPNPYPSNFKLALAREPKSTLISDLEVAVGRCSQVDLWVTEEELAKYLNGETQNAK